MEDNMNNIEEFRDIPGYEGIYQISNFGLVKSLSRIKLNRGIYPQRIKEKILIQTLNSSGYLAVTLCSNGKFKQCQIHMLIALAFLNHKPDGSTKIVVDHKDGNKVKNNLENLQLIFHSQNISKSQKRILPTGVTYDKRRNKYQARIKEKKIHKHLGMFKTPEEASEAYQKAFKLIYKI